MRPRLGSTAGIAFSSSIIEGMRGEVCALLPLVRSQNHQRRATSLLESRTRRAQAC
jgi:hypothetical protein